jgi:hypothetical protein
MLASCSSKIVTSPPHCVFGPALSAITGSSHVVLGVCRVGVFHTVRHPATEISVRKARGLSFVIREWNSVGCDGLRVVRREIQKQNSPTLHVLRSNFYFIMKYNWNFEIMKSKFDVAAKIDLDRWFRRQVDSAWWLRRIYVVFWNYELFYSTSCSVSVRIW